MNLELLDDFAENEGTEVGDTVHALLHAWRYRSFLSENFIQALEAELDEWSVDITTNWSREVEDVTFTHSQITWEPLE